MKRGNGLSRKTPLRATKPLKAKRISIVPGKSSVNPIKPKRQRSEEEEEQARGAVDARSGGDCEVQIEGVCQGRAREFQHRLAKVHGGPWTASNGLAVCGHGNVDGCHGYIHQHPRESYEKGWSVRSGDNPATRRVLRRGQWVVLGDDGTPIPWTEKDAA